MTDLVSAMVATSSDGEAARRAFRHAGLEVGPLVGGTFSITGSRRLFERLFRTRLAKHGYPARLPSDRLPADLRAHVDIVTFSEPLDFGPTDY